MDSSGSIVDYDRYIDILNRGVDAANGQSLTLWVLENVTLYEQWEDKAEFRENIITDLNCALNWGDSYAAYNLGNIYLEGSYDIPQDAQCAWEYFTKGAILGSDFCYEAMYDMLADGIVEVSDSFKEMVALNGTRCGSRRLRTETVKIYKSGGLTAFAPEIEQYYLPLYEANIV
jgi:hypothetical protein